MTKRSAKTCRICGSPIPDPPPVKGPFCSDRCRVRDLGHWAAGDYSLPGEPAAPWDTSEPEEGAGPVHRTPLGREESGED